MVFLRVVVTVVGMVEGSCSVWRGAWCRSDVGVWLGIIMLCIVWCGDCSLGVSFGLYGGLCIDEGLWVGV